MCVCVKLDARVWETTKTTVCLSMCDQKELIENMVTTVKLNSFLYAVFSLWSRIYVDWHHLANQSCCTCCHGNMYTKCYYLPQMHMLAVKSQTCHVTENMLIKYVWLHPQFITTQFITCDLCCHLFKFNVFSCHRELLSMLHHQYLWNFVMLFEFACNLWPELWFKTPPILLLIEYNQAW